MLPTRDFTMPIENNSRTLSVESFQRGHDFFSSKKSFYPFMNRYMVVYSNGNKIRHFRVMQITSVHGVYSNVKIFLKNYQQIN